MQTKELIYRLAYGSFRTVKLQQQAANFATQINNILLDLRNTQSKISRKKKHIKRISSDIQELKIIYIKIVQFSKTRTQYKGFRIATSVLSDALRELRLDLNKNARYQRVLKEEVSEIGHVLNATQYLAREFLAKALDAPNT